MALVFWSLSFVLLEFDFWLLFEMWNLLHKMAVVDLWTLLYFLFISSTISFFLFILKIAVFFSFIVTFLFPPLLISVCLICLLILLRYAGNSNGCQALNYGRRILWQSGWARNILLTHYYLIWVICQASLFLLICTYGLAGNSWRSC